MSSLVVVQFCLIPHVCLVVDTDKMKVDLNVNRMKSVKSLNLEEVVSKDGQSDAHNRMQTFTFEELADATDNFRSDCFLGEGGFGKVYKGHLKRTNQVGLGHNIIPRKKNFHFALSYSKIHGL